jgi:GNAT superfamily N-acetyltransferase
VSCADAAESNAADHSRDVSIRPVSDGQWAIVAWLWQLFRHDLATIVNGLPYADGRYQAAQLEHFPSPDGAGYLAWRAHPKTGEDAPVGFAVIDGLESGRRSVVAFWVAPVVRRDGIGRRLAHRDALPARRTLVDRFSARQCQRRQILARCSRHRVRARTMVGGTATRARAAARSARPLHRVALISAEHTFSAEHTWESRLSAAERFDRSSPPCATPSGDVVGGRRVHMARIAGAMGLVLCGRSRDRGWRTGRHAGRGRCDHACRPTTVIQRPGWLLRNSCQFGSQRLGGGQLGSRRPDRALERLGLETGRHAPSGDGSRPFRSDRRLRPGHVGCRQCRQRFHVDLSLGRSQPLLSPRATCVLQVGFERRDRRRCAGCRARAGQAGPLWRTHLQRRSSGLGSPCPRRHALVFVTRHTGPCPIQKPGPAFGVAGGVRRHVSARPSGERRRARTSSSDRPPIAATRPAVADRSCSRYPPGGLPIPYLSNELR